MESRRQRQLERASYSVRRAGLLREWLRNAASTWLGKEDAEWVLDAALGDRRFYDVWQELEGPDPVQAVRSRLVTIRKTIMGEGHMVTSPTSIFSLCADTTKNR